jgi:hypothetical protein
MNHIEEEQSNASVIKINELAIAIYPLLSPQERKRFVGDLLKEFDRLTPKRRRLLQDTFRRVLHIDGFANPLRAPLSRRVDALVSNTLKNHSLRLLVLAAWFEVKQSIYQAICDFVDTYQTPVAWGIDDEDVWQTAQERSEAGADNECEQSYIIGACHIADSFLELHPEMSSLDIIMAASCGEHFPVDDPRDAAGKESSADEQFSAQEAASRPTNDNVSIVDASDPLWVSWLAEANALPAEHPAWQQLDEFVAALRQVAEAKRQSIAEGEELWSALAEVQAVDGALLERMFVEAISTWELPVPLPTPVAPIVAQVRQLLVMIDEYQQVEAQPAKNRLERDRKRQHLSELEESCETA